MLFRVAAAQTFVLQPDATPGADGNYQAFLVQQADLLASPRLLRAAMQEPAVTALESVQRHPERTVHWLQAHLIVDPVANSETLGVSLLGQHPEELLALFQGIKAAFLKEAAEPATLKRQQRAELLREVYGDLTRRVAEARRRLPAEALPHGDRGNTTLTEEQRRTLDLYDELQRQRQRIDVDLLRLDVRIKSLQGQREPGKGTVVPPASLEKRLQQDPILSAKRAELTRLEEELRGLEKLYANRQDPYLVGRRTQIEKLRGEIKERRAKRIEVPHGDTDEVATGAVTLLQQERALLQAEKEALEGRANGLASEVQALRTQLGVGGGPVAGFEQQRVEFEQLEKLMRTVLDELETTRIEAKAPPRISLLQPPEVTVEPQPAVTLRFLGVLVAGSFGWLAAALVVGIRGARKGILYDADDIRVSLELPVLGTLPLLDDSERILRFDEMPVEGEPDAGWFRAIDEIRTLVEPDASQAGARALLITSPNRGEGRSTFAAGLACRLAAAGRKTLLIDGDLGGPSLHAWFGTTAVGGLADLLRVHQMPSEVIRTTPTPGLWLITAGKPDPEAMLTLAQDGMTMVLDALRKDFEIILIDGFPILPGVQGVATARHADRVIFSLRSGVSTSATSRAALERLRGLDIPVFGVVLGGVPNRG